MDLDRETSSRNWECWETFKQLYEEEGKPWNPVLRF